LQKLLQGIQKFKTLLSGIDMTQGKPWKKLILFTLPLLIGNLFQQLYSTADAMILGRVVGVNALAAVGASVSIFFLIMVIMMGISMGVGVMVSQYFGAKKREELSRTIGAAITITAILGVVIMVVMPFVTRPLLVALDTPPDILDDSVLYMNILIWGILGLAYFNILSGILRGMGDAFSPLVYLAFASILNVVLNLILIAGLGLGVWGAAIGTVFAQGLTAVLCLRRLMKMRDVFDFKLEYLWPQREFVSQVLKLGVPAAASQALFALAMIAVQPLANDFGELFLATNFIIMRIDGFVMMPIFSFGMAMTVYTGQNVGAGKSDRLGIGLKQCILMSLATAIAILAIILPFGRFIAMAFIDPREVGAAEVIALSQVGLRILALGYVGLSVNMVLWGMIRGAGDAMSPLWGAVINTVAVRVPVAYLLVYLMARPEALWLSLLIAWLTNLLLGVLAYRFGKWRTKGIVGKPTQNKDAEKRDKEAIMNTLTVISTRYSHKEKFITGVAVPLSDLELIAQAALDAPSGVNRQTVQLIILPDRESIAPLASIAPTAGMQTAPAAIAILTDSSLNPPDAVPLELSGFAASRRKCSGDSLPAERRGLGQRPISFEKEDYSAAMQNILIAATALGYSSLWLDSPFFSEDVQIAAREALGTPDSFHLWAVIPIGKPDGEGSRREKLPFTQRVSYGRYGSTK